MENNINRPPVKFSKSAVVYALLLIFALIFTQALRAAASALLFWFLLLLPIVSLIYILIGKAIIRVYVSSEKTKVEKLQPLEYELRIINPSPIAYPFIEAVVSVPESDGVRCTEQSLNLSLAPLDSYVVTQNAEFRYRGSYEIGVRCLYISDFLGLFAVRLDVDIYENIHVMPRRLDMNMKCETSATDIPNDSAKVVFSTEKAEIGNIREYIPGDSQKSIHWKLSSKMFNGNLMVKEFNTNTSQSVYMLCDFSRSIPPEVFEDENAAAEREKARREEEKKPDEKHVKLKKAKADKKSAAADKASRKAARRSRKGMNASGVSDAALIDELIDTAAEAKRGKPARDEKPKREKRARHPKKKAQDESKVQAAETLEEVRLREEKRRLDEARRSLAVGGTIRPEYAGDIDEYCADGVVEMSIAAVLNELRHGNNVTLIWTDSRQEGGVAAVELTCPEDFDAVYPVFATAPSCSEDVTTLLPLISESLNVTIRICTSNIDPLALSRYSAVPGLFGGAGVGCVVELLLYNPEERYTDVKIRREYVEMCRIKLAQDGVTLTEMCSAKDESGRISLKQASH